VDVPQNCGYFGFLWGYLPSSQDNRSESLATSIFLLACAFFAILSVPVQRDIWQKRNVSRGGRGEAPKLPGYSRAQPFSAPETKLNGGKKPLRKGSAAGTRDFSGIRRYPANLLVLMQPALDAVLVNSSPKPKLEERLRNAIRTKGYSIRTEGPYVSWYRQFVQFHGKRHPQEMGAKEISSFLTHLAVDRNVAPSTQNQALNALVFLYRQVLEIEVDGIEALRAKKRENLPVVLTEGETRRILDAVSGVEGLVARLLYGCGLRIMEALRLRVKDVDLEGRKVEIRDAKGGKVRVVALPKRLVEPMEEHLRRARMVWEEDRRDDLPGVYLPFALDRKDPTAAKSWPWFYVFFSETLSTDPRSGLRRRHHLHETSVGRALSKAAKRADIPKKVTAHTLRHSFATHLLLAGSDIRTAQELLGHADVRTTEIYTKLAKAMRGEVQSPLDRLWEGGAASEAEGN